MRIIVNHLTRMQPGIFCVAGIDLQTGLQVRPVNSRPLNVSLLQREGGPFGLGRVIELGTTLFVGSLPEVEDQLFDPQHLQLIEQWPTTELIEYCTPLAKSTLLSVFGPDLQTEFNQRYQSTTAYVPAHCGLRSLGMLSVEQARLRMIDSPTGPRLRLEFSVADRTYSGPVTDIRLWQADHKTAALEQVEKFADCLSRASTPILLSVGLSRVYQPTPESPPRHWLQVNNILVS